MIEVFVVLSGGRAAGLHQLTWLKMEFVPVGASEYI